LNSEEKKKWDDGVKEARARLASSQCENDNILGSRYLQPSSTNAYMKHIEGIRYFCFLIGDFDSIPPGRLPSVCVRTVRLFIKWKVLPKGSILVDDGDDGAAILDLEGNEVICAGSWTAPDNIRQFGSALTLCHTSRGNGGAYSEACVDCLNGKEQAENAQSYFGCEIHHPNRKLFRHGDPMTDSKLIDSMKKFFLRNRLMLREVILRSLLMSFCKFGTDSVAQTRFGILNYTLYDYLGCQTFSSI
jgi:hypothetical protein